MKSFLHRVTAKNNGKH